MSHGCFISYKKEDKDSLKKIVDRLKELEIPESHLDRTIDSENIDTVISVLRKEYMNNKPITLFLIGEYSSEDTKEKWNKFHSLEPHPEYNEQSYIIRELRATLSDYEGNPRHGVVGIVLPNMVSKIYIGKGACKKCGQSVNYVKIDDDTVIREFSQNYYLQKGECNHYPQDGRYCILCTFDEFMTDPNKFIDMAFEKSQSKISESVHYKDINHDYKLRDE